MTAPQAQPSTLSTIEAAVLALSAVLLTLALLGMVWEWITLVKAAAAALALVGFAAIVVGLERQ